MSEYAKEKFVLVQREDLRYDEALQTNKIGYYKDAWLRFKKNKASVVAAGILIFLILMCLIGPHLRNYKLNRGETNKWAIRLQYLPPRIKGLEWAGFDGTNTIWRYPAGFDRMPEGIVISDVLETNDIGQERRKIDVYAYLNWYYSYENTTRLSEAEYNAVRAAEAEYDVAIIITDAPLLNGTHNVNLDFFAFLKYVHGMDNFNFWFGTDGQGRDLFTEIWKGASISLLIAFSVVTINLFVGVIIGAISGYYGGWIDLIIERVSEILSGLPFLAILTLLLIRYGSTIYVTIFAFTLTGWLGAASVTRVQFYRYKSREYVLAARTLGAKDRRIMFRHIFPNAVGTLITVFALAVPGIIFAESTYSFLGIINYPNVIVLGRLIASGQNVMKDHFYTLLFPSIFISLLMLSFNLFSNGLRDAFNPSLRGVE